MAFLLVVFVLLNLWCIVKPKSNGAFCVLLIYMWFLSAFCYQRADYTVYQTRYLFYFDLSDVSEPGFTLVMYLFNLLGFNFQSFLIIIYAAIYFVFGWFIKKNSTMPSFVLALYALSLFSIDAVQLRNTMAFSIVLIGINYLINHKGLKSVLIYLLLVMVAVSIHFSTIVYVLLIIPKLCSTSTNVAVTFLGTIIGFILTDKGFVYMVLTNFVSKSKLDGIYNFVSSYSDKLIFNIRITMIIMLVFSCVILVFVLNNLRRNDNKENIEKAEFFLKTSLIIFVVFAFVGVSADIYRAQRYTILLLFIAMSYCIEDGCENVYIVRNDSNGHVIAINKNIYKVVSVCATLVIFIVQIYFMGNFPNTFVSIFKYNLLI